MAEPKVWLSANIKPANSTITASVQDGNVSAKATVKTYRDPKSIKVAAREAEQKARETLAVLKEVYGDGADG